MKRTARRATAEATPQANFRVLPLVRSQLPMLPRALMRIGKHVLENPDLVIHQSASELALVTNSGPATIMRFCRALGYAGLREFKLALAGDLATRQLVANGDRKAGRSGAEALFDRVIEAVRVTQSLHDASAVQRLASMLASARRIDVYGGGVSGIVAQYLTFRLLRIGLPVHAIVDPTLSAQLASGLGANTVAIAFSESGLTEDIVAALRRAKGEGADRRDHPSPGCADRQVCRRGVLDGRGGIAADRKQDDHSVRAPRCDRAAGIGAHGAPWAARSRRRRPSAARIYSASDALTVQETAPLSG
jgi:DNA-binding MurR/RpiR family transcriptional regulator